MFTVGNSEMAEKHNYKVNVIFAGGVTMQRWRHRCHHAQMETPQTSYWVATNSSLRS